MNCTKSYWRANFTEHCITVPVSDWEMDLNILFQGFKKSALDIQEEIQFRNKAMNNLFPRLSLNERRTELNFLGNAYLVIIKDG